jgi:hypothetical protein
VGGCSVLSSVALGCCTQRVQAGAVSRARVLKYFNNYILRTKIIHKLLKINKFIKKLGGCYPVPQNLFFPDFRDFH